MEDTRLQDCLCQLEEVAKVTEGLAISNQGRASSVEKLVADSRIIKQDIKTLDNVLRQVGKTADALKLLSLNTAIEAAHIPGDGGKGFAVIAKEMKNMSEMYETSREKMQELSDEIENKIDVLVNHLDKASTGVTDTSASLEELTASTEELVATLEHIASNL